MKAVVRQLPLLCGHEDVDVDARTFHSKFSARVFHGTGLDVHHSPGQLQLVGVKFNELECGVAMENNELCKYEPSSLLQGQCACEELMPVRMVTRSVA